jgi:hypothetical protein
MSSFSEYGRNSRSMIKDTTVAWGRRILGQFGFQVLRATPVSIDGSCPRDFFRGGTPMARPVVLQVPVLNCRGLFGLRLDATTHPLVQAASLYVETRDAEDVRACLHRYYSEFRPSSPADVFGISPEELPGYTGYPAEAFGYPWRDETPSQRIENVRGQAALEAAQQGWPIGSNPGHKYWGPVSGRLLDFETARLVSLVEKMSQEGYRRHDGRQGDAGGRLLVHNDGRWCATIGPGGQHRVAVAAALGMEEIPLRFKWTPYYLADVDHWPGVRQGLVTRAGAIQIFERVVKGDFPSR